MFLATQKIPTTATISHGSQVGNGLGFAAASARRRK